MWRPLRAIAGGLIALAVLAGAYTVETVGGERMAIGLPYDTPKGSVILVPGGTTLLKIGDDGTPDNIGNFVIRIRSEITGAGFATAYVERPFDLRAAIARMRTVARPVFLLATSNGTSLALKNAAALGSDGPDGLILTSTVTNYTKRLGMSASDVDVAKIAIPVLFIHNKNDKCNGSPPGGIAPLIARMKSATDVQTIVVASDESGGLAKNEELRQCSPSSPHGYMGIDDDVSAKIVTWLDAHVPAH